MKTTQVDAVILPPLRDLGDDFKVRRALPSRDRRMVGPFVFFDHFGPATFAAGNGLDVRPHPHIGLATITYLFDGSILHRDSLGTVCSITPGAVNWMTAGRGIVHSERTSAEVRRNPSSLAGLQCWVGLPRRHEEAEPSFVHTDTDELPVESGEGILARVVAGSFLGRQSPLDTLSPVLFADIQLEAGGKLPIASDYTERAVYIAQGSVEIGKEGIFDSGRMLVLKPDEVITIACHGKEPARIVLVGGEPLDGPRYISWNFVSSSRERIVQAGEDWREQRFAMVADDPEFIPLPDSYNHPVDYP